MCGIAGFFGKPDKDFNPIVYNYLLLAQDARGRDNFGVAYTRKGVGDKETPRSIDIHRGWDGKYSGGKDTSTFEKVIEEKGRVWIKRDFEWSYPIVTIGHSRTASKGGTGIENAHPFVISSSEEGVTRKLIGVHNGTVTNFRDVVHEMGIDIGNTQSDSKALLTCMAQSHEKAIETLSLYRGGAAFVWHIKEEPNRVYVWVGNDLARKNFSPERPLHYIQTVDGIYISSLARPLNDIMLAVPNWKDYVESPVILAESFETDAITVIEDGEIVSTTKVERKPLPYIYYNRYPKKESSSSIGASTGANNIVYSSAPITPVKNNTSLAMYKKVLQNDFYSDQMVRHYTSMNRLYVQGGLYYFKGKLAHTKVEVDEEALEVSNNLSECFSIVGNVYYSMLGWALKKTSEGRFVYNDKHDTSYMVSEVNKVNILYFYKGLLVKGTEHLLRLHHNMVDVGKESPAMLRKATRLPVWVGLFNNEVTIDDISSAKDSIVFAPVCREDNKVRPVSGLYHYPYTNKAYFFKTNMIAEAMDLGRYKKLKALSEKGQLSFCTQCSRTVGFAESCDKCLPFNSTKENDEDTDLYTGLTEIVKLYNNKYRVACLDCSEDQIQVDKNQCEACGSINVNSTLVDSDKAAQYFGS